MSKNDPYRELAAPVVAVAFTAIVLLGMLQRLPLSVDFTDEAETVRIRRELNAPVLVAII